jgi:hypothetical protein
MKRPVAFIALAALAAGAAFAQDAIKAARGARRFTDIAALPVTDPGAQIHYEGSIDRGGYNGDYNWGTYQDKHGDWVLMETDKPGCLFNFVQHRALWKDPQKCPTPVFKFYFEGEDTPRFTISRDEFGEKAPFLRPLSGAQYGGGVRGFSIVRAFCPMEFRKGCKVTSTVELRGQANNKTGPGGWGHIMYHTYPDAEGLGTFDQKADFSPVARLYEGPLSAGFDAEAKTSAAPLASGERRVAYKASKRGTITDIELVLPDFRLADDPELGGTPFADSLLTNIWIELSFDGRKRVEAPLATFYGSHIAFLKHPQPKGREDFAGTNGNMRTALLTFDISGKDGRFSNRFPMPFWESAEVAFVNRGAKAVNLGDACVRTNSRLVYDRKTTGYFTADAYQPLKPCKAQENIFLGQLVGRGQLAYSAFVGLAYKGGASCEGDVRLFLDSLSAPAVQSDGTESWGNWGVGFFYGPRLNPFSFYLTYGYVNHKNNHGPKISFFSRLKGWSLMRETVVDCCYFDHFMRFELEHGDANEEDDAALYGGQIFAYLKERP